MDREQALKIVKKTLTKDRYEHTVRVMETALSLAKRYNLNENQIALAAIFHDYAKCFSEQQLRDIITNSKLPEILLSYNEELWHGPVGAYLVEKKFAITDKEILQAIKYHTTGRPKMTEVEKVVFVADYIEPNRHFPGLEKVRHAATKNLDSALFLAIKNTIVHLINKNSAIFPTTIDTYNYYILNEEELISG